MTNINNTNARICFNALESSNKNVNKKLYLSNSTEFQLYYSFNQSDFEHMNSICFLKTYLNYIKLTPKLYKNITLCDTITYPNLTLTSE